MTRYAWMLGLLLAPVAGADELAPQTRALLHQALEARLTLPTDAPSLQRPVLPPSMPGAARQSTSTAAQSAQTAAANQAAQNVANGRSRVSQGNEASEASRNAAGQARAAEARATGGNGVSHGKGPGKPPDPPGGGKPGH